MDISKEYLIMCAEAKEIQKCVTDNFDGTVGSSKDFFEYYDVIDKMVWLPRQDQLQNMMYDKIKKDWQYSMPIVRNIHPQGYIARVMSYTFAKFMDINDCSNEWHQYITKFDSMEQLWLAFVMNKKFYKIWTGKEWIIYK